MRLYSIDSHSIHSYSLDFYNAIDDIVTTLLDIKHELTRRTPNKKIKIFDDDYLELADIAINAWEHKYEDILNGRYVKNSQTSINNPNFDFEFKYFFEWVLMILFKINYQNTQKFKEMFDTYIDDVEIPFNTIYEEKHMVWTARNKNANMLSFILDRLHKYDPLNENNIPLVETYNAGDDKIKGIIVDYVKNILETQLADLNALYFSTNMSQAYVNREAREILKKWKDDYKDIIRDKYYIHDIMFGDHKIRFDIRKDINKVYFR